MYDIENYYEAKSVEDAIAHLAPPMRRPKSSPAGRMYS